MALRALPVNVQPPDARRVTAPLPDPPRVLTCTVVRRALLTFVFEMYSGAWLTLGTVVVVVDVVDVVVVVVVDVVVVVVVVAPLKPKTVAKPSAAPEPPVTR